jgi:hypothetical protein
MKIIAVGKSDPKFRDEDFLPYLDDERKTVLKLLSEGIVREIYFKAKEDDAVIILECDSEAEAALARLPLVKNKMISFELIPLIPYPGFARII